jgi:hypothetical protein
MDGGTAPTGSNSNQCLDIMVGGGCVLCRNIIPDQIALTGVHPFRPLLYSALLRQQSYRHIAPDIPPPRMIAIL